MELEFLHSGNSKFQAAGNDGILGWSLHFLQNLKKCVRE